MIFLFSCAVFLIVPAMTLKPLRGSELVVMQKIENSREATGLMCYVGSFFHREVQPIKCEGRNRCMNASFILEPPSSKKEMGRTYACGDIIACNETEFCRFIAGLSPYPVSSCRLDCCEFDLCNQIVKDQSTAKSPSIKVEVEKTTIYYHSANLKFIFVFLLVVVMLSICVTTRSGKAYHRSDAVVVEATKS